MQLDAFDRPKTTVDNYQKIYAERHKIPLHLIMESERLQLASFLEYQVALHVLSVPDARRRYVREYPESNRTNVPITRMNGKGETYTDYNYCKGSVLEMIQAYDDSIREVRNIV
jgi:hypothetical protein